MDSAGRSLINVSNSKFTRTRPAVRCRSRELSLLVAFLSNDLQADCLDQFPQRFLQLAQSVDVRYDALQ